MTRYECPEHGVIARNRVEPGDGTPPHRVCSDCGSTVARCWGRP